MRPLRWLAAGLALLLSACASKPQITTDYDSSANFASYRTFGFESPLGTDKAGYSSITTERLKAAVTTQMTQRGYVYQEEGADLLVNFQARIKDKEQVDVVPVPEGIGFYDYRFGLYEPWPGYETVANVQYYTEGTVVVDLIDRAKQQLVWEGRAVGRVTQADQDDPGKALDQTVAEIFAKYPFTAGK